MDETPQRVIELSTNLDDATGEIVGHAIDALLADGALDAWATPMVMKKGRPGVTLSLLGREEDADRLARRVIDLTGTFGVRRRAWERVVVERRAERVETEYGPIAVKVGELDGRVVVCKAEFDAVVAAAERHGAPVREVLAAAQAAARGLIERAEEGAP